MMKKTLKRNQNKFNEAYEQAVTQALSILGKDVSVIITSYIEDKYSVRLSDTADNPKDFSDALDAVINGGKRIVQRRVLRLLYDRIGVELPFAMTTDFEDKILKAKKEFEKYPSHNR
jgi:hypothetical protein